MYEIWRHVTGTANMGRHLFDFPTTCGEFLTPACRSQTRDSLTGAIVTQDFSDEPPINRAPILHS